MAKRLNPVREECRRLRAVERKSFNEIAAITGVPKGSLHYWLKDLPLTAEEMSVRLAAARAKAAPAVRRTNAARKHDRGAPSKFKTMVTGETMSKDRLCRIAESAVQFRLVLAGLNPFNSPFDGERTDLLVENPATGRIMKVQVRAAQKGSKHGRPIISLLRRQYGAKHGQVRFQTGDFDFLVGYDLHSDIAYVISWEEAESNRCMISIKEEFAERWDKLA